MYSLEYPKRPWTTNFERSKNRWVRANLTKEWRSAFMLLARQKKIPKLNQIEIEVEVWLKGGRLQDVAACNPAVKAAIDGLVDAGVIEDDSPEYLKSIKFYAPQRGRNSLVLHIKEVENHV
jgi:crossover junction endodeoxyribonuclease RusA